MYVEIQDESGDRLTISGPSNDYAGVKSLLFTASRRNYGSVVSVYITLAQVRDFVRAFQGEFESGGAAAAADPCLMTASDDGDRPIDSVTVVKAGQEVLYIEGASLDGVAEPIANAVESALRDPQ